MNPQPFSTPPRNHGLIPHFKHREYLGGVQSGSETTRKCFQINVLVFSKFGPMQMFNEINDHAPKTMRQSFMLPSFYGFHRMQRANRQHSNYVCFFVFRSANITPDKSLPKPCRGSLGNSIFPADTESKQPSVP